MSDTDLKPTDYSNTILRQNPENASVVSIFPLVTEEDNQNTENINQASQTDEVKTQPTVPQTFVGGGSSY